MKLISTLYSTPKLEFTLIIQSRNSRAQTSEVPSEPLIVHYRSKIGNESLIFNPSIAIVVKSKEAREMGQTAWITQTLFYRFVTSLTSVYRGLQTDGLFTMDSGVTYMDKKKASTVSMRMSLFRNVLTISPCVISENGSYVKGIDFQVDNSSIGQMTHQDTLGVLELLEHFDLTTFSLLAGVVDELDMLNSKMDMMNVKLDTIIQLIHNQELRSAYAPMKKDDTVLNWEPLR